MAHGSAHRLVNAIVLLALLALPATAEAPPLRVLVSWQSAEASTSSLTLRLSQGTITQWQPLLAEPAEPKVTQGKGMWTFQWSPPQGEGKLLLTVVAPPDEAIEVELDGKGLRTTLRELAESPATIQWNGGRLQLERPASDTIRVRPDHPSLLFEPGQETKLHFEIYLLSANEEPLPTTFRLGLARYGEEPASYPVQDRYHVAPGQPGRARFTLNMKAPSQPGLYELVIRVAPEGGPEVVRRVPLFVLPPRTRPQRSGEELTWDEWTEAGQLVRAARYSGGRWRLVGLGWFGISRLRDLFRDPSLRPAASNTAEHWTIQLPDPDATYLLRVSAQGPSGRVAFIVGAGSGGSSWQAAVWLPESWSGEEAHGTASVLLWPGTDQLEVRVKEADGAVRRGEWQLLKLPGLERLRLREPSPARPDRQRLGILMLPRLDDLFHYAGGLPSPGPLWPVLTRAVANLTTYASATRYDAVALPVVGGGRVTWPSAAARSAFLWDPDTIPGPRQDPVPKDVPELLLRYTARHSLLFVPLFKFDALVFPEGQRHLNPLNPADRNRMVAIVRDFVERYQKHENLVAFGVIVSPTARTCLKDLSDGSDPDTVKRFLQDAKLKVPEGMEDRRLFHWVLKEHRERFIAWRCQQVRQLYEAMVAVFRKAKPEAVCYLLVDFGDLSWSDRLRRASHAGDDVSSILRIYGLDFTSWKLPDGLTLVRTYFGSEHSATSLWINRHRAIDQLFVRHAHASAIVVESIRPEPGEDPVILLPSRAQQGRVATRALGSLEPSALFSAPRLPALPNRFLYHDLPQLLRQLPPTGPERQWTKGPVRIHRWRESNVALWLVANVASHPVDVALEFEQASSIYTAVVPRNNEVTAEAEGRYSLKLGSYGLVLLRSPDGTQLADFEVTLPEAVEDELRRRFQLMTRAVSFLRSESKAKTPNLILDGGFEQETGMGARWEVFPAEAAEYTPEAARSGRLGLALRAQEREVFALSWPFTVPPGAQLTVRLHARALAPEAELVVWLVPTDAPSRSAPGFKLPITPDWKQHEIELPRRSEDAEIWSWRLVFRASGGTVYLDDVEATARTVTAEERNAMIKSLAPALRAWYDERMADFAAITSEYWPQYLLRRFVSRSAESEEEPAQEDSSP